MSRILHLYPAAWRDRYLAELEDLLLDRPPTVRDQLDMIRGAFDAWVHPQVTARPPRRERAAAGSRLVPGATAVIGGGLWIAGGMAMNATQMSPTSGNKDSTLAWIVLVAAAVFTALSAVALARSMPGPSRATSRTAVIMLVGGLLIATPWPILVVGFYGYALATAVFGYLAGPALPLGWLLSVTALVLTSFNTEDERALLTIPIGLAWIAVGSLGWRRSPVATAA